MKDANNIGLIKCECGVNLFKCDIVVYDGDFIDGDISGNNWYRCPKCFKITGD